MTTHRRLPASAAARGSAAALATGFAVAAVLALGSGPALADHEPGHHVHSSGHHPCPPAPPRDKGLGGGAVHGGAAAKPAKCPPPVLDDPPGKK
ncbi:hypothetical protein [Actinomadura rupiterrae]|uniref:hypothetical protein n=1 Tax=Actinomadura rupiterrae TaxID=559627 RepID=UPI0020A2D0A5|nr:hypothetical protein [Actinomadura rupiterrae]MCP2336776.1 hypothetical protein [Actinomadura rupiterrae]